LGIDGASSTVRRALGFAMIGEDGTTQRAFMGGTMLSFFIRAPALMAASKRPPTNMTWILNPEMRGMMYAQDGRERWVVHYQVPPGVDWRAVDAKAVIAAMIGGDVRFEIISGGPWTGGLALVAEHYQRGRVFLAGDAAHLFTPLGGLGMNTGIGDGMNPCWKLAAVRQGRAAPRLPQSYEIERRPMGVRNSQLGVRCTRVMDGWVLPGNFEDDGAAADAARRAFGAKIMQEDRLQYLTVGIQLGERYETSPIVWPDEDDAPPDTWDTYTPLDRPGARAPHFWLAPGRAAYDEFGEGFTLLDFGAPEGARAFEKAARERRVPLKILRLEPPRGLYRRRLVLIRPDQHIAWHGDAVADATAVIDPVRGASDSKRRANATQRRAVKPPPPEQLRDALRPHITPGSGFTILSCSPIDCGHRCGSQGRRQGAPCTYPPQAFPLSCSTRIFVRSATTRCRCGRGRTPSRQSFSSG